MNANEVLANRANELLGSARGVYDPVHPNDHVNRSQSTNDVYASALAIAVVEAGAGTLAGLAHLWAALEAKAAQIGNLARLGRTCLQDALPSRSRDPPRAGPCPGADVGGPAGGARRAGRAARATVVAPGAQLPRLVRRLAETGLRSSPHDPFDALATSPVPPRRGGVTARRS
jgi:aspartate ammonia-lyase